MKWNLLSDQQPSNLNQLQHILLKNRHITDEQLFFSPPHPTGFTAEELGIDPVGLQTAIDRILVAREQKQKIIIFGDYDADGITATAILWQTLHAAGCQVLPFIPDRLRHGYGLSENALTEILGKESKPDLIITVDNGVVAFGPAKRAQAAGVDVIITDHHSPEHHDGEAQYPPCLAIVHTTLLCGATVSWTLANACARQIGDEKTIQVAEDGLDLCGIATIADQVSLTNANRSFAYHGLSALRTTKRPGIKALLEAGRRAQQDIDTFTINYVLGPRINAMGRLAHGIEALRLLCTTSLEKAREQAVVINQTNADRQELTSDLVELALKQAQGREDQRIIVVASDQFHEGVVGLVAGKLVEEFGKPAIAISMGQVTGKASARSVPGVNIIDLIRLVREDLLEAGGHPMAAGFSLETSKLELVRQRLEAVALTEISMADLEIVLNVDVELPYNLVTKKTVKNIEEFAPFGKNNPEPVFLLKNMRVLEVMTMGKKENHLRLKVVPADNPAAQPISCVGWGLAERAVHLEHAKKPIDLICNLTINRWKDREYLQAVVVDVGIT